MFRERRVQLFRSAPEGHTCCGPDQCDQRFGDHGAEKDRFALLLILQATRHKRRLGGVKTRYGSACDGNEQRGKNRETRGVGFEIMPVPGR